MSELKKPKLPKVKDPIKTGPAGGPMTPGAKEERAKHERQNTDKANSGTS